MVRRTHPPRISRRRFLVTSSMAAGACLHADALLGPSAARASADDLLNLQPAGPLWTPCAPSELLVSVDHGRPLTGADVTALTAALNGPLARLSPALQLQLPPSLRQVPPAATVTPKALVAPKETGAAGFVLPGRGQWSKRYWTFFPGAATNGAGYQTVIEYDLVRVP